MERRGGAGAEVADGRMRREGRLPRRIPFHVESEHAVMGEVRVNVRPVGHRRLGGVTVLPVPAPEGLAAVELPLPEDAPRLEVETVEVKADHDLLGQLAVAGEEPAIDFLRREPLGAELGDVVVAEVGPERRSLHFLGAGGGGQEDPVPPDHGRGPAHPGDGRRPLHVLGPGPGDGEVRVGADRIR